MTPIWTVARNTGSRAYLTFGVSQKELTRPQAMSRHDFFSLLMPGISLEDGILRNIVKTRYLGEAALRRVFM